MNTQETVNTRQDSVNKRQSLINTEQAVINEQTKISISIPSFWGIILIVIGITSFYLYNQFTTTMAIKDTNVAIKSIEQDVAYIRHGLETHLTESIQARKEMRVISDERDANFATIFAKLARLGL